MDHISIDVSEPQFPYGLSGMSPYVAAVPLLQYLLQLLEVGGQDGTGCLSSEQSQWNVMQPGSGFKAPGVTPGLASSMRKDPPPRLQPKLPDTSLRRPPPPLQAG